MSFDSMSQAEFKAVFRDLNAEEEKAFRQWARDNYQQGDPISTLWHPVVLDEIRKIHEDERDLARAQGAT